MKRSIITFFFCVLCGVCFSQKKATLIVDSVVVVYNITNDSSNVIENIELENLSSSMVIYLPRVRNHDNYFFILGGTLYSNFGVMNSRLGYPNLSLDLELVKINPKQKYSFSVTILKGANVVIDDYFFSFDYICQDKKTKLNNAGQDTLMKMIDYATGHKYGVVKMKGW